MLIPASGVKNIFIHKIQIDNYYKKGALTLAFLLLINKYKNRKDDVNEYQFVKKNS